MGNAKSAMSRKRWITSRLGTAVIKIPPPFIALLLQGRLLLQGCRCGGQTGPCAFFIGRLVGRAAQPESADAFTPGHDRQAATERHDLPQVPLSRQLAVP